MGDMTKRVLISGLWFVSMWVTCSAVNMFLRVPSVLMLLPAIAIAAGMWIALARAEQRTLVAAHCPRAESTFVTSAADA